MKPEQQRIAIAEACGWKWHSRMKGSIKVWDNGLDYVFSDSELPDYLNDLNAMNEAEATLNYEQGEQFEDELCDICDMENRHKEYPLPFRFAVVHATTQQRAEAFLRTLNLWNE